MSKSKKSKPEKQGRAVGPTRKQKRAVDNILSGKFKSKKAAMVEAGYSELVASDPKKKLVDTKGVNTYIKQLDLQARERWNKSIREKVMDVYADGLDATKLYGKQGLEHPDHMTRKAFADRLAEFFGWDHSGDQLGRPAQYQQFNFFSVDDKRRSKFNEKFKEFVRNM